MSVTADQGQASREALSGNFDNSLWIFRGNVKITMEQGQLTADDATVNFVKKLLGKAVANGKPAQFQQLIEKTGKVAHGHADTIDYDASKGIVRLSKNAWLSDGQNEIHGEMLRVQRRRTNHRRGPRRTGLAEGAHHPDAAALQTMSVLRALNLAKSYKSRQILKDISLEVESGEVVGLLGPNGAGKTTAFYMIVGLTRCEHGEIYLDNKNIGRLPMHRRAQLGVGYLPQEPSVFRRMSVESNIMAILETRPGLDEAQRGTRLGELLEELHIGHVKDSMGMSLSGGERRRVEIARALAADPRFILLDEPFAGVDPLSVADIQRIIKHLSDKGIGVLITDHNVRETLGICERAYIVSQGTVLTSGSADQILANREVREVYLGQDFKL